MGMKDHVEGKISWRDVEHADEIEKHVNDTAQKDRVMFRGKYLEAFIEGAVETFDEVFPGIEAKMSNRKGGKRRRRLAMAG